MKNKINILIAILLVACLATSSIYLYIEKNKDKEQEDIFVELSNVVSKTEDNEDTNKKQKNKGKLSILYEQNPDLVGWIKIDGTNMNYPVMQTENERKDYYLRRNFYKEYSYYGTPYIAEYCNVLESDNIIIYGHHIKGYKMFGELEKYKNVNFYNEHRIISFETINTNANYEIISVFKTIAYTGFKYYEFEKAKTEKDYQNFIKQFKNTVEQVKRARNIKKINKLKKASNSIKKGGKTIKTTAKTAKATVKNTERMAKTSVKMAKKAIQVAKVTAKATIKVLTSAIKAIIAVTKAIVTALIAGGWVAVVIVVVICLIGLICSSVYGIFFSSEEMVNGKTMSSVIREINMDFNNRLTEIQKENPHDEVEITNNRTQWKDIIAIYAVLVTGGEEQSDVITIDENKIERLKNIFWEMTEITSTIELGEVESDAGIITTTKLHIFVNGKTADEMADKYNFNNKQRKQLSELTQEKYASMWNSVIYGSINSIGSTDIVGVAKSQLGNIGGEPFWSWYGFTARVEWCACFVSWCANQCGYIDGGIIPKFAKCTDGVNWFQTYGRWKDGGYEPKSRRYNIF